MNQYYTDLDLDLQHLSNLDSMFDDMASAVELLGVNILSDETVQTLEDFKSSGVTDTNYTLFQSIVSACVEEGVGGKSCM